MGYGHPVCEMWCDIRPGEPQPMMHMNVGVGRERRAFGLRDLFDDSCRMYS